MAHDTQHYRSILKASSLIGGSAFINILIGMVRTKFVAVLLGPAGVGLIGLYTTLLGPIATITGMGLSASGVRQIAEAYGAGNEARVSAVVTTLRRTVWGTGLLGSLATVVLSPWLSQWTFETPDHTLPIAILGLTVLFGNIAVGQSCVLQGLRRIGDLAKIQVIGALCGTVISIPCFFLWGTRGILPSLVLTSLATMATSWFYARRVRLAPVAVRPAESVAEVKHLLGFGLPLMLNGLQGALCAYFLRLIILNRFGLDGVGMWGAAFAISGILVNFVLTAMGTDYYPRLTAVAHDNRQIAREVNVQTEVGLLLAAPALLATILFAPLGVHLFYSGQFDAAIPVLRWSVYGVFGRVISWPLGFILLAQGRGRLFLATELFVNVMHLALVDVCTRFWGLTGAGAAFALLYVVYTGLMVVVAQAIARTHWTRGNVKLIAGVTLLLAGASVLRFVIVSPIGYYTAATVALAATTALTARALSEKTGLSWAIVKRKFAQA